MRAIVSGGTKGIGKAIVHKLASMGYDIAFAARNLEEVQAFKNDLSSKYRNQEFIGRSVDYSKKFEIKSFTDNLLHHWGGIDLIINNVGSYRIDTPDSEDDHLKEMIDLNLKSAIYQTKPFLKSIKEQYAGTIITICSVLSKEVRVKATSYTIAKHALYGYHKLLKEDLSRYGVNVVAILPGSVNTSSWDGIEAPKEEFVQPEDIANTIETILASSSGSSFDEVVIRPKNLNF